MKKAILFCVLTALFLTVNTASAEECYLELRGGVGKWKGPCKDGEAHGTGSATFPNGTYAGSAKDGRAHGRGKMRFQDGIHLEGEFRNGEIHGLHVGKDAEGNPIIGELQMEGDGQRRLIFFSDHRQADEKKPAQEAASGESRPEDAGEAKAAAGEAAASGATGGGEPARQVESAPPDTSGPPGRETSSPGVATAPARAAPAARECRLEADGKFFDWSGPCRDGKAHGNGRATLSGGMTYAGSAKDGILDGYGTVTSASGQMLYQGGYRDGAPHGRGTFLDDDDRYYVSDFDDGHEVGERIPAHDFASGESPPENAGDTDTLAGGAALAGLDEDGNLEGDDGYEAAVDALDGGDGVVRAATPDDDYDAKLAELERREALEIEARFREKQLEAESRSEAIKAELRKKAKAKEAEKLRRDRAHAETLKASGIFEDDSASRREQKRRVRTRRRRSGTALFGGSGGAKGSLEDLSRRLRRQRENLARQRRIEQQRRERLERQRRVERQRRERLERQRRVERQRRERLERQRRIERQRQERLAHQRRVEQQRREQIERQRREQKERERRERLARLARERDRKIARLRNALNRALARCNRLKRGRSGCRNSNIRFYNGEIRNARRNYEILSR